MKNLNKSLPVYFLFAFLAPAIQAQTWIMVESDNSVTYIKNDWIKSVEVGEEGDFSFIFNASRDLIIIIDDANAAYAQGSGEEYCLAVKSLQEEMNKQMPPEHKKMMQDLINDQKAKPTPKVTVSKGTGGEIAGYPTSKYSINVDGELFEEKWITNDPSLNSILNVNKSTQKLMSKTITCALPDGWPLNSSPEFSAEYKEVENSGIELKSVSHEYGSAEINTDVISIDKEDIPDEEFDVPGDYENIGFKELLMSMSDM